MELANSTVYACIGKACGSFASVYLAKRWKDKAVAIRVCPLECQEITLSSLLNEIKALRSLKHPNIIALGEVIVNGDYLCMVFPLVDFGSVTDLIHARFMFGIPESAMTCILFDLLKAIDYIHSRDFIHRGIRCSHILISSDGRTLLSGFRNAISVLEDGKRTSIMHDFRPDFKSSLLWLAPEVLQQNLAGYGSKSDIYSVGISACEMANGFPPFSDMAHMQMLFEKLRGTTPRLLDASTLMVDDMQKSPDPTESGVANEQKERRFSPQLHNFTELCLRPNPAERPSASEILYHPFFKQAKRHRISFRDVFHPVKPLTLPGNSETPGDSMERRPSLPTGGVATSSAQDPIELIDWKFD